MRLSELPLVSPQEHSGVPVSERKSVLTVTVLRLQAVVDLLEGALSSNVSRKEPQEMILLQTRLELGEAQNSSHRE